MHTFWSYPPSSSSQIPPKSPPQTYDGPTKPRGNHSRKPGSGIYATQPKAPMSWETRLRKGRAWVFLRRDDLYGVGRNVWWEEGLVPIRYKCDVAFENRVTTDTGK